jgi:hypothetical protein
VIDLRLLFQCCCLLFFISANVFAAGKTYVILWFDTEDYIDPISDDAALRIANDLSNLGVRATFKVVGEKARVLEKRQRNDVIQALSRHCIGYHSNWHSIQPTPSIYEQHLGLLEGTAEFVRREGVGANDVSRIFGIRPACFGQPGSSWAPQIGPGMRKLGIPVYLDSGSQVGLNDQPFWYDGILYVYEMGPYQLRGELDHPNLKADLKKFDDAVQHFAQVGGGLISTYYHPTEFAHTEFWDAANFSDGASKEQKDWVLPKRRTPQDAERCFNTLSQYVKHAKATAGVQFIAADDLLRTYANPLPPQVDRLTLAKHLKNSITYLSLDSGDLSAADILLELLGMPAEYVDGPAFAGQTRYTATAIPTFLFDAAVRDVRSYIETNKRLPGEVLLGSQTLSLPDFAATLADHILSNGPVRLVRANVGFDQYVATNADQAFKWPIHPKKFSPVELLAMARLQAWTLKPARLR